MNQLVKTFNTSELTMTSREIAELVGSRHDKVKQSIVRLSTTVLSDDGSEVIKKAVISKPPLGDGEKRANGFTEKVFIFTGDQGNVHLSSQLDWLIDGKSWKLKQPFSYRKLYLRLFV